MQNNLRLSTSNSEFSKALLNTLENEEEFLIWQSFIDHRSKASAKVSKVNLGKDLIVDFNVDGEIGSSSKDLYLFNETSEILFKGEVLLLKKNKLQLKISEKKYLKESRSNKRVSFNNIIIKIIIKTKDRKMKDGFRDHEVIISDISESGVSFVIPRSQSLLFEKGNKLSLSQIEKIKLPENIQGVVVHRTQLDDVVDESGNKTIIVGVKFTRPSALLEAVIKELYSNDVD